MQTLTVQELDRRLKSGEILQLVDVRSPDEYRAGHIPGAINIPMDRCEARLEDLHASVPVVLICQSGRRAGMTHELLSAHRSDMMVLEGGTAAWIAQGLPVVRDTVARWSLERQTRLVIGILVFSSSIASLFWPPAIAVPIFMGAGLIFAGLTDICGLGLLLAKMPWNRPQAPSPCNPKPATSR